MSGLTWLPLLAFLAPLPPMRPDPPKAPSGGWLAMFLMGAAVFTMVAPMVAIWGFHRPDARFRTRCEAAGGHVVQASISGDGPPRCRKA